MLPSKKSYQKGFTLIEVLVSMLIIVMFLGIAMHLMVIASIFKARAEQYDRAVVWIQEDLEQTIFIAQGYEHDATPYSLKCNATVASSGLAAGLLEDPHGIGGTPKNFGTKSIGGTTFTMTRTADYTNSFDPFKLLTLNYTVAPANGGAAIVTISTEVIANAVFKCP
ncbi:prepilin-type N-terminal cleavage/methylation domain-containing protein [Chlorogloea sp. CCALA 695]|uniref:prepilin-type N-terminal cleavage/methylation domain-containing protein n=1 Tax=Chlorogloea sp. CCALA 695 TaxID=2107693 RepID=UPI000D052F46|nr:prepilin-type N-terminal cleavage/methylation domain-containing protein [Chlorogloea sp. CCALA 695]PSB35040.1 prepilin-type cleavage/methylation domain-containing protein [Chlorogloea sp. CCALA 695]